MHLCSAVRKAGWRKAGNRRVSCTNVVIVVKQPHAVGCIGPGEAWGIAGHRTDARQDADDSQLRSSCRAHMRARPRRRPPRRWQQARARSEQTSDRKAGGMTAGRAGPRRAERRATARLGRRGIAGSHRRLAPLRAARACSLRALRALEARPCGPGQAWQCPTGVQLAAAGRGAEAAAHASRGLGLAQQRPAQRLLLGRLCWDLRARSRLRWCSVGYEGQLGRSGRCKAL
jgi:hypothetical protein